MSANTRGDYAVVLVKILRRGGGSYVGALYLWSVSDDQKWEIKPLGIGYMIKRVSVQISFTALSAIEHVEQRET